MKHRSAGEWASLIAVFVFAGALGSFGVAILASWIGLPAIAVWLVVVILLAILAYRLFRSPSASDSGSTTDTTTPGGSS
jgi:peptidoglycan/LPS O-acetylase OafA/YrhL